MAFKELASLDAETVITIGGRDKKTGKANPTNAEGYYLGNRVVKGSKYGDSTLHFFQTAKGNLGVWGKTNLNNKLAAVNPGTMIRVTYAGLKSTKNGDMHSYKVEVDADNTIDVESLEADALEGNSDGYATEDRNYEEDESTGEDYATEAASKANPAAANVTAANKARVEALLRSNKAKN